MTNDNYILAVDIQKERYRNVQETVKTHYDKIMKLQSATSRVTSLRYLLDNVNKHLRDLQVLGQDIESELFVSVLWSKISHDVLLQLQLSFIVTRAIHLEIVTNMTTDEFFTVSVVSLPAEALLNK